MTEASQRRRHRVALPAFHRRATGFGDVLRCGSMQSGSGQHLSWIPDLCREVATSLSAIARGDSDGCLIFPLLRHGVRRVSEQESKILIAHWLEARGLHYSVETPTAGLYQQTGLSPQSARVDVTVYGSNDPSDRVLNIELKAGMPPVLSFSKDIEKLLVEARPGLWFHTLAAANAGTWPKLASRIGASLESKLPLIGQPHPHLIYFCYMRPPTVPARILRDRRVVGLGNSVASAPDACILTAVESDAFLRAPTWCPVVTLTVEC